MRTRAGRALEVDVQPLLVRGCEGAGSVDRPTGDLLRQSYRRTGARSGPAGRRRPVSSYAARLFTSAVVLGIASAAFYVAFAQAPSAGTYQDVSCSTLSTATFTQNGVAYVLFEVPAGGPGLQWAAEEVSGTGTVYVISHDTGSATTTCYSDLLVKTGTYSALLIASTTSPSPGNATSASAVFTALPIFVVYVYADPGCSATSAASVSKGLTAYVQF